MTNEIIELLPSVDLKAFVRKKEFARLTATMWCTLALQKTLI